MIPYVYTCIVYWMKENMNIKNILISGAGIAGLTCAYWLKKYGFNLTIVEKHEHLRADGYKIDIRGKAVDVIKKMGLYDEIKLNATQIKESKYVNASGKIVSESHPDLCGVREEGDLEIVRGTLCEILYAKLNDIEFIFDDQIIEILDLEKGASVCFEKGGKRDFDVVIGADGLHSQTRKLIFGEEEQFLKPLGLYISFYSIPNYMNLDRVEFEYHSPKKFAIAYCPKDGLAKAGFAFSANSSGYDLKTKDEQQKFLVNAFKGEGWEIPKMLELIKDAPDFYFDYVAQVHMDHWCKKHTALVGDSGYAVSPLAGQGSSVALVGAYILAGEIACNKSNKNKAFENYESLMKEFIQKNQELAKMSAAIMEGNYSSWIMVKVYWISCRLGQLFPARFIQYWKKKGLKQTTKAANSVRIKSYSNIK